MGIVERRKNFRFTQISKSYRSEYILSNCKNNYGKGSVRWNLLLKPSTFKTLKIPNITSSDKNHQFINVLDYSTYMSPSGTKSDYISNILSCEPYIAITISLNTVSEGLKYPVPSVSSTGDTHIKFLLMSLRKVTITCTCAPHGRKSFISSRGILCRI